MRELSGYLVAISLAMFCTLAGVTWLTGLGIQTEQVLEQPAMAALAEASNPLK